MMKHIQMIKEKNWDLDNKDSKMNKKATNDQKRILKARYSNQIYQIRESIMKFLDKEIGTLDERLRTLFKQHNYNYSFYFNCFGDDPWSSY